MLNADQHQDMQIQLVSLLRPGIFAPTNSGDEFVPFLPLDHLCPVSFVVSERVSSF